MSESTIRYGVNYVQEPVPQPLAQGDGDSLANDIQLQATENVLTLRVTSEQYKLLLSAALNGAARHFPENWIEVIYPLIKAGKEAGMTDCEDVADCIEEQLAIDVETNEPVNSVFYNFITNVVNNTGFGDPNSVNATITTIKDRQPASFPSDEINDLSHCDLNSLWAGIRHGIVERLDENARDLLEDLTAYNDLPQRFTAFIDIVPILGDVAEAIAVAATEVIPDILNKYNAHSSTEVLDAIACDIFALVCSECRYPTYEEVWNYYATGSFDNVAAMEAVTTAQIVTKLSAMIGALAPDTVVYHTMIIFELFTMYLGATFNGENPTLARFATLGEDWSNDNWLQLCETCNEQWQIVEYDFKESPHGWKLLPQIGSGGFGGVWVAGSGWQWTNNASGNWAVIGLDIEPQWRIRGVGFNYTGVVNIANSGITFRPTPGSNVGVVNQNLSTGMNYNRSNCALGVNQAFRQIQAGINAGDANPAYIEKAFIVFDAGFGIGGRASDRNIC